MRLKEFDSNGMGANDAGWSATGGSRPIAVTRTPAISSGVVERRIMVNLSAISC
jgi:hypothetical protein